MQKLQFRKVLNQSLSLPCADFGRLGMMQSSKTPYPQSGQQKDMHKVRPQVYAASISYSVAQ
jgi:hypothetical protein